MFSEPSPQPYRNQFATVLYFEGNRAAGLVLKPWASATTLCCLGAAEATRNHPTVGLRLEGRIGI